MRKISEKRVVSDGKRLYDLHKFALTLFKRRGIGYERHARTEIELPLAAFPRRCRRRTGLCPRTRGCRPGNGAFSSEYGRIGRNRHARKIS